MGGQISKHKTKNLKPQNMWNGAKQKKNSAC